MTIQRIDHESKHPNATITLYYEELRDIANGLCELNKLDVERDADFHKIHRDMAFLFDLVKNGCICSDSVAMLEKLQKAITEAK